MREYSFDRPLDRWHRTARTWFDGTVESVDRRLADCRKLLVASQAAVGSNWGSDGMQAHIEAIASLQDQQRVLEGQRESLLVAATDREARGSHETLDVDFGENAPDHTNPYTGERGRRTQLESTGDGSGFHWKHEAGQHDFSDEHYRKVDDEAREFGDPGPVRAKQPPELYREWDGPRGAMAQEYGEPDPGRHRANLAPADARYVELEAAKLIANNPGVDRDELTTRAIYKAQVETSTFSPARSRAIVTAFAQRVAQLHRPAPRQRTAATSIASDCADEMMFVE